MVGHGHFANQATTMTAGEILQALLTRPDRCLQVLAALQDFETTARELHSNILWRECTSGPAVDQSPRAPSKEEVKEHKEDKKGPCPVLSRRRLDLLEAIVEGVQVEKKPQPKPKPSPPNVKPSKAAKGKRKYELSDSSEDVSTEITEKEEPGIPVPQTLSWSWLPVCAEGETVWSAFPACPVTEHTCSTMPIPTAVRAEAKRLRGRVYWMPECREAEDWWFNGRKGRCLTAFTA